MLPCCLSHFEVFLRNCSDEGLTLEMSVLHSLYGGNFVGFQKIKESQCTFLLCIISRAISTLVFHTHVFLDAEEFSIQ